MMVEVSAVSEIGNSGTIATIDRATYFNQLLNLRSPNSKFQDIRDRAAASVHDRAIPSTRDEEWRFTDVSDLLSLSLKIAEPASLSFPQIEAFLLPETTNSRLVFVDGVFAADLSAIDDLPDGVVVSNLETVLELMPSVKDYIAKLPGEDEVFTALNTASLTDSAIVFVPRNQDVEVPIHLLFVSTQAEAIVQPRVCVIAETGSRVTLIEDFVSLTEGAYFTNTVTEIAVAENAEVRHTRVQRDSNAAFHIGRTAVSQARDSRYSCTAVNFGGRLSRHNLDVYQTGEQTETTLNGLTVIDGDRIGDTHSLLSLSKPYGVGNQVNKTIASDRAHAIFNGKVFVPQAAQQTDARQLSRNLLLSPKARVDTKPQLEIVADNVKCAHGATVSQLEDDEVFYLQSRGIDQDSARKLLTYAFAIEIIDQIPVPTLRDRLSAFIRSQHT
ncbi:Fe-S cluster assembly protein SufD [Leptolyngbya sp. DQ-M1]|uniref:Fe-S cluster assembly protein SufD n=1 Tax=Leptolyngbya sp. DQ-M1 TaxID=2933920 RepID=UPI00329795ED